VRETGLKTPGAEKCKPTEQVSSASRLAAAGLVGSIPSITCRLDEVWHWSQSLMLEPAWRVQMRPTYTQIGALPSSSQHAPS